MSKTTRRIQAKNHPQAFAKLVAEVKKSKNIQEISSEDFKKHLEDNKPMFIIDVREESERCQFFIDGSVHISKGVLERDIEGHFIPEDQKLPIVTICSGGFRSALAAASLLDMGYKEVYSLAGGLKDYLEHDFDNIIELNDDFIPK